MKAGMKKSAFFIPARNSHSLFMVIFVVASGWCFPLTGAFL